MIYLLLSIICNVLLLVIIKGFDKFSIPNLQGIVVNYFVAGSVALVFVPKEISRTTIFTSDWFGTAIILGTLFISIFFLISLTAQKISISVASVANKMSLVIPVLVAILFFGDKIQFFKIAGILLALVSVYLTTKKEKEPNKISDKKELLLPLFVFLGSGIIDALVNFANEKLIKESGHDAAFSCVGFFAAGSIGILIIAFQLIFQKKKFQVKSIVAGIILGIPNFFSIYFILKALSTDLLESSQLYPLANICIVVLSALAGLVIFKEKLSKLNIVGIALSIVATLLISFS